MEVLFRLLEGSYAYLLIFQILVVTLLFLVLLWLIVKRTRASILAFEGGTAAVATIGGGGAAVPTPEDYTAIKEKLLVLEEENARSKQIDANKKTLEEKVKYLEQKLLEYEILQEEIGTLSKLKLENEKLKQKVVELGASLDLNNPLPVKDGKQTSAPSNVTPKKMETEVPKVDPSALGAPTPVALSQETAVPSSAETTKTPPSSPATTSPTVGLEGLLSRIDELTQSPNKG